MFFNNGIILLVILVSLQLSACSEAPHAPLRVGGNQWPGYEPLYLARDLNFWKKRQIRLIQYPSATEVLRAFRNLAIEAASLTLDEVLLLRQLDIPVSVILIHDFSNGADAIISHSDIQSVKQLQGKTVGVESSALGAFVLSRALETNNMALQDVSIRHINFEAHEKAFINNEVDAVVTFEPAINGLLSAGANMIFDSTMMPGEIIDVLVVHQDCIDKYAHALNKLVTGWFWALDYMDENQLEAYLNIAERLNVSVQQVEAHYKTIVLPDRNENNELLGVRNYVLQRTVNQMSKIMLNNKLLNKPFSNNDLFTNQFINDVIN
ncbi:MAG: ABC transporter substrate-binding protein [Gammaproteobacteria bacterium]|nr:ABC transporter substrate-binding protein [Gammaproteobacteria bacterium]